jgi:hypothetical protein
MNPTGGGSTYRSRNGVATKPATSVTTQQQILYLLRELVEEFSIPMLFVTHDLSVALRANDDETSPPRKFTLEGVR